MTEALHRLVALAAVLAPARAVRLLGRLQDPEGAEAVRRVGALALAPRRARLAALASALPGAGSASPTLPASPGTLPDHPLARRLEVERRSRATAGRTLVRGATAPAPRPT